MSIDEIRAEKLADLRSRWSDPVRVYMLEVRFGAQPLADIEFLLSSLDKLTAELAAADALLDEAEHDVERWRGDYDELRWCFDNMATRNEALAAERDALKAGLCGDVHIGGDLLTTVPLRDDPVMSRIMVAEAQRGIAAYMVDVGRITAERDAALDDSKRRLASYKEAEAERDAALVRVQALEAALAGRDAPGDMALDDWYKGRPERGDE